MKSSARHRQIYRGASASNWYDKAMLKTKIIPHSSLKWHQIATLVLAFFAFFMSALISRTVFERLPHLEDELAYQYQARIFAGGQITIESPEPRQAFWQPFVVDHRETDQRFGKYTPGWPAILAIGVWLGQIWVINAFMSAITVTLVYRIGLEIFDPETGVIAAILIAFSPAALLLNATLMGHTAALLYATLFIYAYWRMERQNRLRWGAVAGLALGALAASRPLTSIAIAAPFIVWSAGRVFESLSELFDSQTERIFKSLLLLSGCALLLAASIPLFNYAATGDASQNLYELVWDYDRVGFGEGRGRNGHTLEKAFRHARFDLSLTASDLFGWQVAPITPELADHLRTSSNSWPEKGYSFSLLPFGVLAGLFLYGGHVDKKLLRLLVLLLWAGLALVWVLLPLNLDEIMWGTTTPADILGLAADSIRDPEFATIWIRVAAYLLLLPLFFWMRWQNTPQIPYTWLLLSIVLGIVLVQMTYWIGSQRYSTRYYFEALTAAALLSALPLSWLARKTNRWLIIGVVLTLSVFSLYSYSTPRIEALYRFNRIGADVLEQVSDRRTDETPVLIIVNGATSGDDRVRWRSYGTLMAVTSPYLDSDIVVARNYGNSGMREKIVQQFPERTIIEIHAFGNEWRFSDDQPGS